MKKIVLILLTIGLFSNIIIAQVFPQNNWVYHQKPSADGWNPEKIRKFRRYIIDSTKITGLVIAHKGKIVFDYGDIEENSYIASCRKSVLAMLYGKYVENGTINLDKTIEELGITDVKGILPIEKKATVQDLISARSGVYHPEGYPGGMQQYAPKRGSVKPGEYWLYSNWDFNVAGYVFENETGKSIYDEVEVQLAKPLGMQDWRRDLQKKAGDTTISKYLAYPIWFSTRDMARIGLLMLNRGKWDGKQLISESWIDEMIKQRTTYQEINKNVPAFRNTGFNFGYGYMWWLFEEMNDKRFKNAYMASGAMGQAIVIYPEIDVVMAFKTKAVYRRVNSRNVRLSLLRKAVELYDMH